MALGALTSPAVAHADFGEIVTKTFGYNGGYTARSQRFVVPKGVAFVDITADGGGGGNGGSGSGDGSVGAAGGAAGEITGTLPVKPGEVLDLRIGGGGSAGNSSDHCNVFGGSTAGYGGLGNPRMCAGGGGEATYVRRGVAIVAVAGGGTADRDPAPVHNGGDGGIGIGLNGRDGADDSGDDGFGVGGAGGVGGQAGDRVGPGSPINGGDPKITCPQPDTCVYVDGGGGGGGTGYPQSGSGGKAGSGENYSGGGGGGGGDSYTGGPANTAGTTLGLLTFDTIGPSPRGAGTNGQVTISYRAPSTQGFTSADPATSTQGQPVTYSTVIQDNAGITTPTGAVTFSVGSFPLCSATLKPDTVTFAAGSGSCQASNAPVGTNTVTTTCSGDRTFPRSNTAATPIIVTVLRPPATATTTTLTAADTIPGFGVYHLFAQVAPTGAIGTVQFLDGTTKLGSPVPVTGGTASLLTRLTKGPHSLTAVFTPTNPAHFTTSTSPPMLVNVRQLFPF
ncbi:MAG: Ig-like domain-containing protein [Pseudonocardiaceae bacterium]